MAVKVEWRVFYVEAYLLRGGVVLLMAIKVGVTLFSLIAAIMVYPELRSASSISVP